MLTQEQKTILGKPGYCISFLAVALPSRSLPTFCELLVASMITAECFVTQSWFQGRLLNFWGSYHKWLETGCWRSYQIVARFIKLYCLAIPETQPLFLVFDDTLVFRFSEKAPGSGIAFEHAHKLNEVATEFKWVPNALLFRGFIDVSTSLLHDIFDSLPYVDSFNPSWFSGASSVSH